MQTDDQSEPAPTANAKPGESVDVSLRDASMQHAWNWFSLHSGQRMQAVNFFLVGTAFLIAAYAGLLKEAQWLLATGVSVLGILFSLCFAGMDYRTRGLIKLSEHAIDRLETDLSRGIAGETILFTRQAESRKHPWITYRVIVQTLHAGAACVFLVAGVHAATACGRSAEHPPAKDTRVNGQQALVPGPQWSPLRVGYLPIAAELPLFVAVEEGFFSSEGIRVELTRFVSSNELGNAATADQLDAMAGTASNVVFDIYSVSKKRHLAFAMNPYSNAKGHVTDSLLVKKDGPIVRLEQVKGKRVASFPGSVNRIFVNLVLEKHGVPRASYEYLEMPPANWQPALASGAIDVVSALEPSATQIVKDGVGRSVFDGFYADLLPNVALSGHWIAADFYGRRDPAQLAAFLRAYRRAVEFCRDHETQARTHLEKYAGIRGDLIAEVNLNPWQFHREVDQTGFQRFADLLFANQALHEKVAVQEFLLPDVAYGP